MRPDELDPGIRETVHRLRAAGFVTTDSGDGVSKPRQWFESGDALPFQHVVAVVDGHEMVPEAERMSRVLGPDWIVEASYSTLDKACLLFARKEVAA